MFSRLQAKWKVNGWQLTLILCTFAIGGSLCGFFTRQLITPMRIEQPFLYGTLYFVILTLLWPLCVLTVSIPLGQFRFFKNYLAKMGSRLGLGKKTASTATESHVHIAIFASGSGSNARLLMQRFQHHPRIRVQMLVSNKPGAGALHHAADFGVSTLIIEKEQFFSGDAYLAELQAAGVQYIVLAGFLWKVPPKLIAAYPGKIVNIHPALLPKHGGKGMYGQHVHAAVLAAGDADSGITIHLVDEHYDHGAHLLQARCPVLPGDTPGTLAARIQQLEHQHYPEVVERWVLSTALVGK
ncbi:MAG: phosphoribosylglycinamide formyltransferase [Chitinophagaceae bacterium]|nr:phosphoribosylglycinamide formyltransferase [Chitinophagaceae bacterium]